MEKQRTTSQTSLSLEDKLKVDTFYGYRNTGSESLRQRKGDYSFVIENELYVWLFPSKATYSGVNNYMLYRYIKGRSKADVVSLKGFSDYFSDKNKKDYGNMFVKIGSKSIKKEELKQLKEILEKRSTINIAYNERMYYCLPISIQQKLYCNGLSRLCMPVEMQKELSKEVHLSKEADKKYPKLDKKESAMAKRCRQNDQQLRHIEYRLHQNSIEISRKLESLGLFFDENLYKMRPELAKRRRDINREYKEKERKLQREYEKEQKEKQKRGEKC